MNQNEVTSNVAVPDLAAGAFVGSGQQNLSTIPTAGLQESSSSADEDNDSIVMLTCENVVSGLHASLQNPVPFFL